MDLAWADSPHDGEQFERADAGDGLILERHKGDRLVHAILNNARIPILFEDAEAAVSWRADGFQAALRLWDMPRPEHPGGRGKMPLGKMP
jgi:hypothetical protein